MDLLQQQVPYEIFGGEPAENDLYSYGQCGDLTLLLTNQLCQPTNQPTFPVSPLGPPERSLFAGPAEFTVIIKDKIKRAKYRYSLLLNRIYVEDKKPFCVEFQWNRLLVQSPMYVRATTVFADDALMHERVKTCSQHQPKAIEAGQPLVVATSVLVSSSVINGDIYYCGDPENENSWMSLLVKFNKSSNAACRHAYQFVCKNSCPSGINRRATDIIFTLEDKTGQVYGRQRVGVRACASVKRDIDHDEAEYKNELVAEPQVAARNRKRRLDMPVLPPLPYASPNAVDIGLRIAIELMQYEMSSSAPNSKKYKNLKKSMREFEKFRKELKKPPPSI